MSVDEAVALLVKTSEVTFAAGVLVKEAEMPGFLNELVSPTGTAGHVARNALIGSGIGGLFGALRETGRPEDERSYSGGIGRGMLLGGLAGGAGTAIVREGGKLLEPLPVDPDAASMSQHREQIRQRAVTQAQGGSPQEPAPGPSPQLSVLENALNTDYAPPAIREALNQSDPGVLNGVSAGATSLTRTPVASTAGGLAGFAVGQHHGRRLGDVLSQQRRGFGGGRIGRYNPLQGWVQPDSVPGRAVRTTARAGGGLIGGVGGAVLGQGIQNLISKLRS